MDGTKFGSSECPVCNRTFARKGPKHKYCHWQCAAAKKKGNEFERREYVASKPDGWTVASDCDQHEPAEDSLPKKIPAGRYVYAWFSDESPLPFYVGKGVDDRAWKRHTHADGRSQLCQQIRACCKGFRVVVVRDNLTNEGAMLLESALIKFVYYCGQMLSNQVDPLARRERPPLELVHSLQTSYEEATDGPHP